MATYVINNNSGTAVVATIPDGAEAFVSHRVGANANGIAANAAGTGIRLLGQNAIDYGLKMDENLVHLLENFADGNIPQNALKGQLWYDTTVTAQYPDGVLKVCTGFNNANVGIFSVVGGGGPGGNVGEVQFNSGTGGFSASGSLVWDTVNRVLTSSNGFSAANLYVRTGAVSTRIAANSSQSANLQLILPSTSGTAGQALVTDGSGNLAWGQTVADTIRDASNSTFVTANPGNVDIQVANNSSVLNINPNTAAFLANITTSRTISATGNIGTGGNLFASFGANVNTLRVRTDSTFVGNAEFTGANISVGSNANLRITGGANGQVLSTDGAGNLSWTSVSTSSISNGSSNIAIAANGNITGTVAGNLIFTATATGFAATSVETVNLLSNTLNGLDLFGGTTGAVLTTNGSGTLSWAPAGGGGGSAIANGTSSISIGAADGNAQIVIGTNDIGNFTATGLELSSNLVVSDPAGGQLTTSGNASITNNVLAVLSTGVVNVNGQLNANSIRLDDGGSNNVVLSNSGGISATGSGDFGALGVTGLAALNGGANVIGNTAITLGVSERFVINDANSNVTTSINLTGVTTNRLTVTNGVVLSNTGAAVANLTANANVIFTGPVFNTAAVSNITMGPITNIHITGGGANNLMSTDGAGGLSWVQDINIRTANLSGNANVGTFLYVGPTASRTQTPASGQILATDDIIAFASDDRLKTRLGNVENALDKIDSLSTFYFEFNDLAVGMGMRQGRYVGVSAQETQAVLPEIIRPAPVNDGYLTVQYEKFAPLLIAAIKELRAEVNEIKRRLG